MHLSGFLTCLFVTGVSVIFGQQTINPVIGDTSYLVAFGTLPDKHSGEQLRIHTHLSYVEQRLRAADCSELTDEQLIARKTVLDHLRVYADRGQFPLNTAYRNERRPCFIDEAGTICAVGYLVEQTAGRDVAEQINDVHQYDVIADMQLPQLAEWADRNGLTLRECAMIQPTYEYLRPTVYTMPRKGIYMGYTNAFADALTTSPGFEIGGFCARHVYKRFWLQGGVAFVTRNNALNVAGTTFDVQNQHWSASLLLQYSSPFRKRWLQKFMLKAGLQADFYEVESPFLDVDETSGVVHRARDKRLPGLLAAGELAYSLKPIGNRIYHSISVAYLQGMRTTFEGEVTANGQPVLQYGNSGSYLSVRYTFSPVRGSGRRH